MKYYNLLDPVEREFFRIYLAHKRAMKSIKKTDKVLFDVLQLLKYAKQKEAQKQ